MRLYARKLYIDESDDTKLIGIRAFTTLYEFSVINLADYDDISFFIKLGLYE